MLYYIKAKIIIRVAGISGPFEQVISALVHGNTTNMAKSKFQNFAKQRFAHMQSQSIDFEYIEIAGEII